MATRKHMTSNFTRRLALLVYLAALLMTGACRQPATTPDAPTSTGATPARERVAGVRGGTLTYRVSSPPKSLNPLMSSDEASFTVAFMLTSARLVEFDHDAQSYVPGLAETWQTSGDGRTVEATLRDGLKFSDGQPLTAADVEFSLRAIYDERTAAPTLRDALTINDRRIETTTLDARRVRLVFPEPVAVPENYLVNIPIIPRHTLDAELQKGTLRDAYGVTADPQRIVTAGAFAVEAITPGERITLRRNPHYWKRDAAGVQLPYLDRLVVDVVSDSNAARTRLSEGVIDIIDRVRPSDYAEFRKQGGAVRAFDLGPGLGTDHMWFNLKGGAGGAAAPTGAVKHAWFADARFRRAVAHAIDREGIADNLLQGLATPLYGFVSPVNRAWAATDIPRPEYDLERARGLLREAGFVQRGTAEAPELFDAQGNRVEWTLIVPVENEPRVKMAAVIQEDLAQLGMKVQVAPIEFNELRRRAAQSFDYDAALLGITNSDLDPSSYANLLVSSSQDHQWNPKQATPATEWEARIDEQTAALARERDAARRRAVFRDIQFVINEQMPLIPIVARHITSVSRQRVGNHRPSTILPYSMWNADELFVRP